MRLSGVIISIVLAVAPAFGGPQAIFDPAQNQWTLNNGLVRAVFQLTPEGYFLTQEIDNLESGDRWTVSASRPTSPVRLQTESDLFDANTAFELISQNTQSIAPAGVRQSIVLKDLKGRAQVTVIFELYDNQPVLRYSLRYKNLAPATANITWINMVPWTFDDFGKRFTAFRVNQWSTVAKPEDFQASQTLLDTAGNAVEIYSGADGEQCSWFALRDSDQRGLFAGWEFDGRAKTTVRQMASKNYVQISSTVIDLHHPVEAGTEFQTPYAFLGFFHGDW